LAIAQKLKEKAAGPQHVFSEWALSAVRPQGSTLQIGIQRRHFRQGDDQEHHQHIADGEFVLPAVTPVAAEVSPLELG
jgi:hypothetical protein